MSKKCVGREFFRDHIAPFNLSLSTGFSFFASFLVLALVLRYVSMIFIYFDGLIFSSLLWTHWIQIGYRKCEAPRRRNVINGDECSEAVSWKSPSPKIHKSKLCTNLLKCADFLCFLFIFKLLLILLCFFQLAIYHYKEHMWLRKTNNVKGKKNCDTLMFDWNSNPRKSVINSRTIGVVRIWLKSHAECDIHFYPFFYHRNSIRSY